MMIDAPGGTAAMSHAELANHLDRRALVGAASRWVARAARHSAGSHALAS